MSAADLVPEDGIVNAEVSCVQYVGSDGVLKFIASRRGEIPLSQALGLLALAALDMWYDEQIRGAEDDYEEVEDEEDE